MYKNLLIVLSLMMTVNAMAANEAEIKKALKAELLFSTVKCEDLVNTQGYDYNGSNTGWHLSILDNGNEMEMKTNSSGMPAVELILNSGSTGQTYRYYTNASLDRITELEYDYYNIVATEDNEGTILDPIFVEKIKKQMIYSMRCKVTPNEEIE